MKISILRFHKDLDYTIGKIFIDDNPMGFTLEDAIREVPGQAVHHWKRPGVTAIPAGTYPVHVTTSVRFKRPLPLLIDVPGFTGVRIHPGNTSADTASLRAAYPGPWQAKGAAYATWMDACWAHCFTVLSAVQGGTRQVPTAAELIAELPPLVLP